MKVPLLLDLALVVVGVVLIVAGIASWSRAAALIIAGAALIALGILPMRPRRS